MGLDIYVMPLWRFKVGDFQTPLETAGFAAKVVTADGVLDRPRRPGWWASWKARREVAAIRKSVQKANGTPIRWKDEGAVVYQTQAQSFMPLKAYAWWLDHRDQMPEFSIPDDHDYDKHPIWSIESDRPVSSPHLMNHDCYNGYYLPCDFERLIEVEPYLIHGTWPASHSTGSSLRLLAELDRINAELKDDGEADLDVQDPLFPVLVGYRDLSEAARASCQHGLPIIFWG